MAPSKWDDESEESTPPSSPPPARRGKFDDEEDSDVLESWDAAEDSEVEREKQKKAADIAAKAEAEAKAKHKSKSQRIAEHQAESARRRQALEDEDSSDEEDPMDRKRRLLQEERNADLKHAEDLFGDAVRVKTRTVNKPVTVADPADPTNSIDLSTLSIFEPKTKDQFAELRETLAPLLAANAKKAHYVVFMQEFSKLVCKDLKSDEIKKIASGLTTLSNEKLKDEKIAEKGGKKSKAAKTKTTLNTARDTGVRADTAAYDDFDDNDFM